MLKKLLISTFLLSTAIAATSHPKLHGLSLSQIAQTPGVEWFWQEDGYTLDSTLMFYYDGEVYITNCVHIGRVPVEQPTDLIYEDLANIRPSTFSPEDKSIGYYLNGPLDGRWDGKIGADNFTMEVRTYYYEYEGKSKTQTIGNIKAPNDASSFTYFELNDGKLTSTELAPMDHFSSWDMFDMKIVANNVQPDSDLIIGRYYRDSEDHLLGSVNMKRTSKKRNINVSYLSGKEWLTKKLSEF